MVPLTAEERAAIAFAQRYYHEKIFEYPAIAEAVQGYPGDPPTSNFLISAADRLVIELKQLCKQA